MNSGQPLSPTPITRGNILSQARQAYRREGLYYLIRSSPKFLLDGCHTTVPNYFWLWYYKTFKSKETFEFQGNVYHYVFDAYCPTWKNERAAVIPIAWNIIEKYRQQKKRILEVGNMLSFVFKVDHDILDKYEVMEGVINEDVVDFNPSKQYDLIISLMTLQWVGFKETPQDSTKFLYAIENLKRILAEGGEIVVIHGLGENQEIDKLIKNGKVRFNHRFYLKRISDYKFREANWEEVKDLEYDQSIPTANGIIIGIIKNDGST